MNTYISDPNIREAYREDTVGRRYHTPIVSKNNSVRNEPAGECMTLNLNNPMTWKEFKGLSESLQIRYITHLRERYNTSQGDLAKMFGCAPSTIYTRLVALDINNMFNKKQMTKRNREDWNGFLNPTIEETTGYVDSTPIGEPIEEPTITTNTDKKTKVHRFAFSLGGEYSGIELLSRISAFISEGTPCEISIAVTVGDDNA